jgi:hypothetical protein
MFVSLQRGDLQSQKCDSWFTPPASVSGDPLANVCRAIRERDVVPFATLEKVDRVSTYQGHVFQIQDYRSVFSFRADQRFQLRYIVLGHSAAQRKDHLPIR